MLGTLRDGRDMAVNKKAKFLPPWVNNLEQCYPIELSTAMEMFHILLSNTVATSHMWLLST